MADRTPELERWRLILGESAAGAVGESSERTMERDSALDWLYGREEEGSPTSEERTGGMGPSQLSVPDWINAVHELFPKKVIERLEKDAVERYGIEEIVTDPDVLERVEPNETLLAAILRTKHLMNPNVLQKARKIVEVVVQRLVDSLKAEVRKSVTGPIERRRRTAVKDARNFDFKTTIRRNLKTYDKEKKQLVIERAAFHARTQRRLRNWQLILLVDQSGSMVSSAIHSAVTASILWTLPGLKTHLCAFDTAVVDLTSDVTDPVELLMKVQLGGGTYIHLAVEYAIRLVENPRKSIVVLITDLYEGANEVHLINHVRALCQQGTRVVVLGALDQDANPAFNRELATRLANEGAMVGAMTPMELVEFVAEALRS